MSPTSLASGWLLLLWLLLAAAPPAYASVTLVSFTASAGSNEIMLEWETATEIDNAGFFIQRSTHEDDGYARISPFIPAQGDSLIGAVYNYVDQDVQAGVTYYYMLEAIDYDQSTETHGPVSATVALAATETPPATATPTPTETATLTATSVPTQSATPAASDTPTASATPTTTPTTTLTPTITRTPTVTATPTWTWTPDPDATATPRPTWTLRPTSTPRPTRTPTPTFTLTATPSATLAPNQTAAPTEAPTSTPTPSPPATSTATSSPTVAEPISVDEAAEPTASSTPLDTSTAVVSENQATPPQPSSRVEVSPVVEEVEPAIADPIQSELSAPDSPEGAPGGFGDQTSLLVGGGLALLALLVAGWLYTTTQKQDTP